MGKELVPHYKLPEWFIYDTQIIVKDSWQERNQVGSMWAQHSSPHTQIIQKNPWAFSLTLLLLLFNPVAVVLTQ